MSHLSPRAKIALGFACLMLSMSVTFFNPTPVGISHSLAAMAAMRRIEERHEYRVEEETRTSEESERLLREVSALHEDLQRLNMVAPPVSSPAE